LFARRNNLRLVTDIKFDFLQRFQVHCLNLNGVALEIKCRSFGQRLMGSFAKLVVQNSALS
jgi:hypothetical protein